MSLYISLNRQIQCEYICQQLEKFVTEYQKSNVDISNSILVISIKQPIDSIPHTETPKIGYNP